MTRREFIGGAVALSALSRTNVLYASGETPNLTIGVVSDLHINGPVGNPFGADERLFVKALEYFRGQGVDGVVIPGDLANCGLREDLKFIGETWRCVFPDDKLPNGQKVEKLFVTGNHDACGLYYGKRKIGGGVRADIGPLTILADPARAWREAFDEEYAPIWRKTLKGYDFVGAQWHIGIDRGKDETFNDGILDFYAAHGKEFDPHRPFFHIQHPHPKDTCYGQWAWGRDDGRSTKALAPFKNAIAISGHSHYSLTDERSVWQGAFTSVGAGSLRYTGLTSNEFPPDAFENSSGIGKVGRSHDAEKLSPCIYVDDSQQGMLWKVYDDRIVISRRDFGTDLSLGPDWVLPLRTGEKPFAFKAQAARFKGPKFMPKASLNVRTATAKTRGKVEKTVWDVEIPPCVADPAARVYRYEVTASSGAQTRTKRVLAEGFNHAPTFKKTAAKTHCRFAVDDFKESGAVKFSVTPFNFFGKAGVPLAKEIKV